jgi:ABC-type phosphate transport system permease subunit
LLGAVKPALVQNLGIPAIVFGIVGMVLAGKSMRQFLSPPKEKMFWWYEHLGGMLASYIAAWTAFSVTTIGRFVHGGWVIWVLPTAIGSPAIALTTAYYKRKFAPRTKIGPASVA